MDCDWRERRADAAPGPRRTGRPVWYQKQMWHHMVGPVGYDDFAGLHPRLPDPRSGADDRLLSAQARGGGVRGFRARPAGRVLRARGGPARPCAAGGRRADVLADPEGVLAPLCAALGIAWDPAMLRWPPGGARPTGPGRRTGTRRSRPRPASARPTRRRRPAGRGAAARRPLPALLRAARRPPACSRPARVTEGRQQGERGCGQARWPWCCSRRPAAGATAAVAHRRSMKLPRQPIRATIAPQLRPSRSPHPDPGGCSGPMRTVSRRRPTQVLERSSALIEQAIRQQGSVGQSFRGDLAHRRRHAPAGLGFACADTYLAAIRRTVPSVLLTPAGGGDAALADFSRQRHRRAAALRGAGARRRRAADLER